MLYIKVTFYINSMLFSFSYHKTFQENESSNQIYTNIVKERDSGPSFEECSDRRSWFENIYYLPKLTKCSMLDCECYWKKMVRTVKYERGNYWFLEKVPQESGGHNEISLNTLVLSVGLMAQDLFSFSLSTIQIYTATNSWWGAFFEEFMYRTQIGLLQPRYSPFSGSSKLQTLSLLVLHRTCAIMVATQPPNIPNKMSAKIKIWKKFPLPCVLEVSPV